MYGQVRRWRAKTFACDIGYDSRGGVNGLGVDKCEWEGEVCRRA